MSNGCVIVRYCEIALKRGNRQMFEKKLVSNIKKQLERSGVAYGRIYRIPGRIIVETENPSSAELVSRVFGVSSASPAIELPYSINAINEAAVNVFQASNPAPESFRVSARRLDKSLEYTSQQLESIVGQHIVNYSGCRVSLKNPLFNIGLELKKDVVYLYTQTIDGVGGLPVGVSGRVMVLVSGGIDSPVAAWMCLKRGCDVSLLHFLHEDYSKTVPDKIIKIRDKLLSYHSNVGVLCVPVQSIEREIVMQVPAEYRILVLRRIFLRIAEMFCKRLGFDAIVSGDNIGQVAFQTLVNMSVINDATSMLWIRPLECFDKQDIVNLSRKIGTYDVSLQEYVDCCNFLVPRHPSTAANLGLIRQLESNIPDETLEAAFKDSFWVR